MSELGIVFDLDDTLYLERDYVKSGFRAVAETAVQGTGVSVEDTFGFLWNGFLEGSRGSSFDALLKRYPQLSQKIDVTALVQRYREHLPEISYLPGIEPLLAELKSLEVPLAIISDGPLVSQAAKAEALNVSRYANPVVLTDAWGQDFWKPHVRAFDHVGEVFGLPPGQLVYVGDNPLKDFHAPTALGWRSVRLRLPEQVRENLPHDATAPTWEVRSVAALRRCLLNLL